MPNIQQRSVEQLIERNLLIHNRGVNEILDRFRNTVIIKALDLCSGNVARAAKMLKISENELQAWNLVHLKIKDKV